MAANDAIDAARKLTASYELIATTGTGGTISGVGRSQLSCARCTSIVYSSIIRESTNPEEARKMIGKHKLMALFLFFGAALVNGPVAAQHEGLEVKTAGDISYVSGGVGASEQEALEQVKSDYNIQLLFAVTGSGAFLAEVPVTIADSTGQVLAEAVSSGPYFYARVPAGTYRVSAENAGNVQTRSVTVPKTGTVSQDFRWAAE